MNFCQSIESLFPSLNCADPGSKYGSKKLLMQYGSKLDRDPQHWFFKVPFFLGHFSWYFTVFVVTASTSNLWNKWLFLRELMFPTKLEWFWLNSFPHWRPSLWPRFLTGPRWTDSPAWLCGKTRNLSLKTRIISQGWVQNLYDQGCGSAHFMRNRIPAAFSMRILIQLKTG